MGTSASHRLGIARELYEQWNAPLHLLGEMLNREPGGLERRAKSDGWTAGFSTVAIRDQLLHLFDQQIAQIKSMLTEDPLNQSLGKELATMVKTLEGFATVETRLSTVQAKLKIDLGDRAHKKASFPNDAINTDGTDVGETTREHLSVLISRLSDRPGSTTDPRSVESN